MEGEKDFQPKPKEILVTGIIEKMGGYESFKNRVTEEMEKAKREGVEFLSLDFVAMVFGNNIYELDQIKIETAQSIIKGMVGEIEEAKIHGIEFGNKSEKNIPAEELIISKVVKRGAEIKKIQRFKQAEELGIEPDEI